MNRILGTFLLLSISFSAFAGAWGAGSFENDTALDWTYDLEETNDANYLIDSLNDVFKTEYIDADVCTNAIAASEVIASMKDGNRLYLPELVEKWLSKNEKIYEPEMAKLATKAIEYCLNIKKSELAQLWYEASSTEWKAETKKLKERLK